MPDEEKLEKVFVHKVLKMVMEKDKIHEDRGEKLTSWTNSGLVKEKHGSGRSDIW